MKSYKFAIVAMLIAGSAFAVKQVKYSKVNDPNPQWFNNGIYLGSDKVNPVNDTEQMLGRAPRCKIDYDFAGIIPRPGFIQETPVFTCPGVRLGDPCFVGVVNATPQDGGSAWEDNVNFFAIAKADAGMVIRLLTASGDGGAMNPPDAGYVVRCIGGI